MTAKLIAGIDSGVSGGIALLTVNGSVYETYGVANKTEREIAEYLIAISYLIIKVYLEQIGIVVLEGGIAASTAKLNRSFGVYLGLLYALKLPFETPVPLTWQRAMKCITRGDKKVTRLKAQQLFPEAKVTHQTADALLIAEFGRREYCRTQWDNVIG